MIKIYCENQQKNTVADLNVGDVFIMDLDGVTTLVLIIDDNGHRRYLNLAYGVVIDKSKIPTFAKKVDCAVTYNYK